MRFVRRLIAFGLILSPLPASAQGDALPAPVAPSIVAAREAMLHDPENAFYNALAAERQAARIADPAARRLSLATARWLGGEALVRTGHLTPAKTLVESARGLADGQGTKLLGDILMTKGGIDAEQVRFADALAAYQSAYRAFVAARDRRGQAIALQSIANLYVDGGDFANAERYFRQAEEAFSDDPVLALALYNNRATGLMSQRRFDAAAREYRRALEIARKQPGAQLRVRIIGNIAKALLEQGRTGEAKQVLGEALSITATPAAAGWRPQIAGIAAQLALQQRDLPRARDWLDQAFANVDIASSNASFRDAHSTAYEVYRASGETALALAHLQALRRLTDEETRLAASTNTALMAARFDFANQELRIARLKAEELRASVALERSRARFQQALTIGVGGGAVLIVGLLTFGIVTLRRSRNQVRAANIELAGSNAALEKALAAKTEFLATTSHEIRTPLNGILGMTQVMLADRGLPPVQRDRVQVVHGAGLTMRALVDDILDVAKMETGHLTVAPEPTDLKALLAEVARMWTEQARTKGLDFRLDLDDAPGWIVTDAGRVRQVAFNLLGNALKFTDEGSIGLAARTIDGGRRFTLAVSDSGIGIPAEKHEQIFESFRQADSTTTRQFGGTGLGLTICRNLARALGGDIAVESREGEGATFVVTLPLVAADAPIAHVPASADGGLLLLERNPIARAMLRTVLAPRTAQIALVDDIEAAIAQMAGVDRLLVDAATLGDDDGTRLDALDRLARSAAEQGVVGFVLWKAPDPEIAGRIKEMAAMTLVEKPIAGPALAERLFGVLNDDPPLVTEAA